MFSKVFYRSVTLHVLSYVLLTNVLIRTYLNYHMEYWGYLGYLENYSEYRHIVATVGAMLLAIIVPRRIKDLTSFTLVLVASSTVCALLALYAARGYSIWYLLFVGVVIIIVRGVSRLKLEIPPRVGSIYPVKFLAVGGVSVSLLWIAMHGAFSSLSFDIYAIYSVRDFAMEQYFTGPFAYIMNWATKIFGTTTLALGIINRNPLYFFGGLASLILFYATLGQVTPLAMIVFVFAAIYAAHNQISAWFVNASLIAVVVISELLLDIFGVSGIVLNSIAVKRLFFGPADAMVLYYEFFSDNPFTYFSTTFLRGVVESPYDRPVLELIALVKTGDTELNPNVGILGTGYQHMGFLGLLIYAFLAGAVLALFNSLSRHLPAWVPMAIGGPSLYIMFTSSDFTRSLFTHGGLVALVILFLWPARMRGTNYHV